MPDFLLICGQSLLKASQMLTIADEMQEMVGDAQIDIATTEKYAPDLEIGNSIRRIISVPALDTEDFKQLGEMQTPGGLKDKLWGAAKKISGMAGKNAKVYWEMTQDIRLVRYDKVFDFDSSAFTLGIARLVKAEQIIGFDPRNVESEVPGAALFYHERYHVSGQMSLGMRMRRLVGHYFEYSPSPSFSWTPQKTSPPTWTPESPFALITGQVPPPFLKILQNLNIALIGDGVGWPEEVKQELSALETIALSEAAMVVVGNGRITTLAALSKKNKVCYIGHEKQKPEGALLVTTPAEFSQAIETLTAVPQTKEVEKQPEQSEQSEQPTSKIQIKKS